MVTMEKFSATYKSGKASDTDGVGQDRGSLVVVDECGHSPKLGQSEPVEHYLWLVLHQKPDVVSLLHSLAPEEVGHLVGDIVHL